MTQHELIIEYCKMYGKIIPARISGTTFLKGFFGHETPKRCRELINAKNKNNSYKKQILIRYKEKINKKLYSVFRLADPEPKTVIPPLSLLLAEQAKEKQEKEREKLKIGNNQQVLI